MKMLRFLPLVAAFLFCATPASAQNNPAAYFGNGTITTSTAGAGNAVAVYPMLNAGSCSGVVKGTWTGTLEFDVSGDAGTTVAAVFTQDAKHTLIASSQTTSNTLFNADVASFQFFEVRAVATMTGAAVVQFYCSPAAL